MAEEENKQSVIRGVVCNTTSGKPYDLEQLEGIDFTDPPWFPWIKDMQESAIHWCKRAKNAETKLDGGDY